MEFTASHIPDVVIVDPIVYEDARGFLMETWRASKFAEAGIDATFVQDVHSRSAEGAIRGLHYQVIEPQGKLLRVISGEIFDVAVDLRRSSPTFGNWVGETLSAGNRRLLWIPPGFAHGFMVMSEIADIEYRMTAYYAPQFERTIRWDDPDIAIDWPLEGNQAPLLSDKDEAGVLLKEAETYA
jgi:dTDP-4-dehydrorhamnose 3,5-epimerase